MNKPVLDSICKNSAAFISSLPGKVVTDNRRLDYDVQLSWLGIDRDDITLLYSTIGDEYP